MNERDVRRMFVAQLKVQARQQNARCEWAALRDTISDLERVWKDDHAAQAFYTELEQYHEKGE